MKTAPAFAAAMAAAIPVMAAPSNNIALRQTEGWTNPDGGNVQIQVGDNKFRWGTVLPSSVLNLILEECTDLGCPAGRIFQADTMTIDLESRRETHTTLNFQVQSVFNPNDEDGNRDQLVSIAKELFYKMFDEGQHTLDTDVLYFDAPCQQTPSQGCVNPPAKYADQWFATDSIIITIRDEDQGLNSFLNIGFSVSSQGGSSGVCSGLTGLGGALAGAIPGIGTVTGFAFSLASVACGLT